MACTCCFRLQEKLSSTLPPLMWFQDAHASAATIQCNTLPATTPATIANALVQLLQQVAGTAAAVTAAAPLLQVCYLFGRLSRLSRQFPYSALLHALWVSSAVPVTRTHVVH